MARVFNGVNQHITFGSDTTIDNFNPKSVSMWIKLNTVTGDRVLMAKSRGISAWAFTKVATTDRLIALQQFTTTTGNWTSTNAITSAWTHVAMTYNNSSIANTPVFYINGALETTITTIAPVGTASADAAETLYIAENSAGTGDLDGSLAFLTYYSGTLTATQINRHRYWGCSPGGPSTQAVWQPLWTTDTKNKGTAVADGTLTGSTVGNAPIPTVRPSSAMMGIDIGW